MYITEIQAFTPPQLPMVLSHTNRSMGSDYFGVFLYRYYSFRFYNLARQQKGFLVGEK